MPKSSKKPSKPDGASTNDDIETPTESDTGTDTTQPNQEEQTTVPEAGTEVSQAQPNPPETLNFELDDFKTILDAPGDNKSEKLREVFASIHAQDATFLNDPDRYNKLRSKLVKRLDCTPENVNKAKRKILQIDGDNDDGPRFLDAPAGGGNEPSPTDDTGPILPAEDRDGGPPITPPGQEVVKWKPKHVGMVMGTLLNLPNNMWPEEWERLSKEEKQEIGEEWSDLFNTYFPTTEKKAMLIKSLAALEGILSPRASKVIKKYTKKKKAPATTAPATQEAKQN